MSEEETKETKEAKKKTVEEILAAKEETEEEFIDPKLLVTDDGKLKVDLVAPKEFEYEIMAEAMVEHQVSYKQCLVRCQAARGRGENAKAEELARQYSIDRLAIAMIQAKYPGIQAVADSIMKSRAKQVSEAREKLLKAPKPEK